MKIKRFKQVCFIFVLLPGLAGCVSTGTKTQVTSGQDSATIEQARAVAYDGPKARIAVSRFDDRTGKPWYTEQIGDGMADQLTTALFNSNRYIVLERQSLDDVLEEQDLGASGRVKQETAAPIGEIEGAELLVIASVTEFKGDGSGQKIKLGAGGFGSSFLGALTGGFKSAHMAIDLRVIDSKTSRIVLATSVRGESSDFSVGAEVGHRDTGPLKGALDIYNNTPVGKAIRVCIQNAVDVIVSKTPDIYYRH